MVAGDSVLSGRDFCLGQTAEVTHLDDLRLPRIHDGQLVERVVECEDVEVLAAVGIGELRYRAIGRPSYPAFPGAAFACVVDQDLPHQPGGDAEEMPAVFPSNLSDLDQPQVGLVDKRGGLKRVLLPLRVAYTRPRYDAGLPKRRPEAVLDRPACHFPTARAGRSDRPLAPEHPCYAVCA